MKSRIAALLLLAVITVLAVIHVSSPVVSQTCSINPNVPVQNSPLTSAPIRGNFAAACNDINSLFAITGSSAVAWTPNLQFCPVGVGAGPCSSVGITYVLPSPGNPGGQVGYYVRSGKFVFASFVIALTSKGAATGRASISGLPLPLPLAPGGGAVTSMNAVVSVQAPTCLAWTDGLIYLEQLNNGSGQVDLNNTNFLNSTFLVGTVQYITP